MPNPSVQYAIKELTSEGRLVEVVTREMYDYEDRHALSYMRCATMEEAVGIVQTYRGIIRHTREVVIVAVMEVPADA